MIRLYCRPFFFFFNFYEEYIMWNVRLDESQPRIKISWRNINNLRYADDITLVAGSELKSLLLRVNQESEKASLKLDTANTEDGMVIP